MTGTRFPTRDELLAWGLVPCRNKRCHMLINAELLQWCTDCMTAHRRRKRKERT